MQNPLVCQGPEYIYTSIHPMQYNSLLCTRDGPFIFSFLHMASICVDLPWQFKLIVIIYFFLYDSWTSWISMCEVKVVTIQLRSDILGAVLKHHFQRRQKACWSGAD